MSSRGRGGSLGGNRRASSRWLVLLALALTLGCLVSVASAAAQEPPSYVSLGDSYTAGPGIAPQSGPPDCGQSAANYPHLVAAALGLSLTDVSCSGATTSNMTVAQFPDQPPQFAALTPSTEIVSLSIGGNDNDFFGSSTSECTFLDEEDSANIGAPCKQFYRHTLTDEILNDGSAIGQAIAQIHALSPKASVFMVGYPDLLPRHSSCFASLPWTSGDYRFWDGLERTYNKVFKSQAAIHGATFVETYKPSIGHDICQPLANRWMEPLYGGSGAALHPNATGELHQAIDLEQAMAKAGIH